MNIFRFIERVGTLLNEDESAGISLPTTVSYVDLLFQVGACGLGAGQNMGRLTLGWLGCSTVMGCVGSQTGGGRGKRVGWQCSWALSGQRSGAGAIP
jgi:hypothetical protein